MAWVGIAASVAGSLLSSSMQEDAAGDASAEQAGGTRAATAEQRRQFDLNRADLAPYRNIGGAAVNRLGVLMGIGPRPSEARPYLENTGDGSYAGLLAEYNRAHVRDHGMTLEDSVRRGLTSGENYSRIIERLRAQERQIANPQTPEQMDEGWGDLNRRFTLADFWDDPVTRASFDFGLNEGRRALDNMAGARGNRNSGAQVRALTRFGTDYTGNQAAGSYNRFYGDQDRTFNRLSGVAGTGQTAATNTAALGQQGANNISNLMSSQGNARGAAAIAGSNAMGTGFRNAGTAIGNWWNNQSNQNQNLGYNPNAYFGGQNLSQPDFSAGYY